MNKKTILSVLVVALLVAGAVYLFPTPRQIQADTPPTNRVTGYIWSSNIGWVKLSSESGDASPFGITLDFSNGFLSGYAWGSNIGWIKFNQGLTGPSGNEAGARLPMSSGAVTTGLVTGWAQACSVFVSGCAGALKDDSARGGWDGWIKMNPTGVEANDVHVYDVTDGDGVVHKQLGGFAWGADVIGWLKFDPTVPVGGGQPPGCTPRFNCQCGDLDYPGSCPPPPPPPGGQLNMTCNLVGPGPYLLNTPVPVDLTSITPVGGSATEPYLITWGGDVSGTGPSSVRDADLPVTGNYSFSTLGSHDVIVSARDSVTPTPLSGTCLTLALTVACPAASYPNATNDDCVFCAAGDTYAECQTPTVAIQRVLGQFVTTINEQSTSLATSTPPARFTVSGGTLNNIHVANPTSLPSNAYCYLLKATDLGNYTYPTDNDHQCSNSSVNLISEDGLLIVGIPTYSSEIGNAPRPVALTGTDPNTGQSVSMPTASPLIFRYLVPSQCEGPACPS